MYLSFSPIVLSSYRGPLADHGGASIIMTNGDNGSAVASEISRRIQEAYGWDSLEDPLPRGYDPPREPTYIELPVSVLGTYIGRYEKEDGEAITISLDNGELVAQPDDDRPLPIFPETQTVFSPRSVPVTVEFVVGPSGETDALVIRQGPYEERYTRVR